MSPNIHNFLNRLRLGISMTSNKYLSPFSFFYRDIWFSWWWELLFYLTRSETGFVFCLRISHDGFWKFI
jgi:hypothetical protein